MFKNKRWKFSGLKLLLKWDVEHLFYHHSFSSSLSNSCHISEYSRPCQCTQSGRPFSYSTAFPPQRSIAAAVRRPPKSQSAAVSTPSVRSTGLGKPRHPLTSFSASSPPQHAQTGRSRQPPRVSFHQSAANRWWWVQRDDSASRIGVGSRCWHRRNSAAPRTLASCPGWRFLGMQPGDIARLGRGTRWSRGTARDPRITRQTGLRKIVCSSCRLYLRKPVEISAGISIQEINRAKWSLDKLTRDQVFKGPN